MALPPGKCLNLNLIEGRLVLPIPSLTALAGRGPI